MKHIITSSLLLIIVLVARADNDIESFNIVSYNYVNRVDDIHIIRQINGGTVITPIFDASCPEEMKGSFAYACKILEEYMPPCLPLKVNVSCGRLSGSYRNAISKVIAKGKEDFGNNDRYSNATMSMIKGVILSELCYGSSRSYLDSIPDVAFLTQKPDLEITYNEQMLNEISFSLEPNPGQKYDFISLVLRDLLKGLGLTSSYRSDPATRGLQNPSQKMTPFESFINETLGNYDNPFARMSNATRGYLTLKTLSREQLKLYAPNIWQNGVSLNYFIPQDDSSVSQILSYMFCKGMVTRSLDDDYSQWIFRELLGWKP